MPYNWTVSSEQRIARHIILSIEHNFKFLPNLTVSIRNILIPFRFRYIYTHLHIMYRNIL